ncbi:GYF domain-containing protein [Lasiodiplodia theobromae]|uniref:GYF domain-containing protein n=1 Tax=Lasiodiplodia theobromae TaxID=45133 RepID=UPI0015C3B4EF|nr:GYF domain-containing protein [Lasiodiplodia theobromae]KAF4533825.1 GYF domain-containing protein [Lasiodiplodia theobromae]
MAPSTFASAAAGSNSTANSTRNDSGGEWARRANGATQTFRRPSHATSLSNAATINASSPGVYVPPHRNGAAAVETRYPKDSLLSLFRQLPLDSDDGLDALYAGGWEPQSLNGASGGAWGRSHEHGKENPPGPDVCWDRDGSMQPLGLTEMTEEEKEAFTSSVNSPLKLPNQNANKDNNAKDGLGRKTSVSHANGPGEAYPFPAAGSPATSRFQQESNAAVPPPALLRRRTDYKEPGAGPGTGQEERDKDKAQGDAGNPPFGLKRSTTGPFSAGLSGPSSPWSAGPQSAGFSPMGSFGNFSLAANTGQASTPTDKRPGLAALRGESRFKGLMNKDSSEDMQKTLREKASMNSLGKVPENDQGRQTPSWMESRANRPLSNDTDPFPDDDNMRSGSAALGGGQDTSPPRRQMTGFGTPQRQDSRDESGFSAFGMTADNTGFSSFLQSRDAFHHHTPQHHGNEPMSPTDTNPYQSPQQDKHESEDIDTDGSDIHNTTLPGLGGFMNDPAAASGMTPFGGIGNMGRVSSAYEAAASDRSQTSSVGPNRGFPSLGGLAGLPGLGGSAAWTPTQPAVGTPSRERFNPQFADNFGSVGEMHSPSLAGLGPNNLYGAGFGAGLSGTGSIGRGSKLGSLFPTAMQEQMRTSEQNRFGGGDDGSAEGDRQPGSFARNAFGGNAGPLRETDSPFRGGRGVFDEMLANSLRNNDGSAMEGLGQFTASSAAAQTPTLATTQQQGPIGHVPQGIPGQPPNVSSSASNQPPAAQQRTMVMPDRMRWVYRDPSGKAQGPWTGLEMHDWFKAGFFSPELLVKKEEDPEYEPLAQLIRRIGNSREPFLVPQIGIPHGPPSTQPGNAWANTGLTAGAQPPFPNSFPSFGTTLTAEQQNALERRKQEEQYLMARQKEHLAQQQVIVKQMQMGMHPHQLHHHSSAHSLHSQPSFGSIASPGGYQPSPTQGPLPGMAGFFDNSFRPGPASGLSPIGAGVEGLGSSREELPAMLDRMNFGRAGQMPFGAAPGSFGSPQQDGTHAQQVANMLNDRARLHREQSDHDSQIKDDEGHMAEQSADRLQQFKDLREEHDREAAAAAAETAVNTVEEQENQQPLQQEEREEPSTPAQTAAQTVKETETPSKPSEPLSLTEQVKAASAKQTPAPQSPWAKVDTSMPMPFPPPQSGSPLPAPAAQRKQNLADALHQETRSRSQTPSVDTPSASIAPWAKETVEAPKGPSLKEIQEAEAKQREEAEAAAQAARAEAQRRELLAMAEQAQPQPSLPSSATWASSASPVNAPGTPSAWSKATVAKTPNSAGPVKKTLQQIQKEEEARKQKAAAAAAASAASAAAAAATTASLSQAVSGGKRYADLASKQTPVAGNAPGGAWTTVGASGKIKTPAPAAAPASPAATRTASAGSISAIKPKPAAAPRTPAQAAPPSGTLDAKEEFKKWAANELRNDLVGDTDPNEFVSNMLSFPSDLDIVTEAVHSVSRTIDSRHFAQEFIRRRKLADKGIIENSGTSSPGPANGSGGWSEVAKKGSSTASAAQTSAAKEDLAFKVVAAKKKGGRK